MVPRLEHACQMSQCRQTNSDVCLQKEPKPVAPSEDHPNVPTTSHHDGISKSCQRSGQELVHVCGTPQNWTMLSKNIRALDDKPNTEINAFQGKPKKWGKLTPEE
jgi:hypothetical protein